MISPSLRHRRRETLWRRAREFGVKVSPSRVCDHHSSPLDFLYDWIYDRPSVSVVHGPRGGGKSYLSGLATHIDSLIYRNHATKILGGSLAQAKQIYGALKDFDAALPDQFATFLKESATYHTGSQVEMLAASATSVRGPHVPTLCLDEVDEIDDEIRDSAMGMCMSKHGIRASVRLTSTWHNIGGAMEGLKARADDPASGIPWHTFCAFEVLERCPEERSGPDLEHCPSCPLVKWCHDTRDGIPKAKRSNGHYAIESLIQKTQLVSLRVFEADYLCLKPKADGLWFPQFDEDRHANAGAEYDPRYPVHLAIDSGVCTGAVLYQQRPSPYGLPYVTVFGDYFDEGRSAEANARALIALTETLCEGRRDRRWTDPAGGARNPVGPTVMAEYARCGLPLNEWPRLSVADSLSLVESSLLAANGFQRLFIHPRCKHLIRAFGGYRRAKKGGQWRDWPEDPQHPFEDLIDALRGGMNADDRPSVGGGAAATPKPRPDGLPRLY